MKFNLMQITLTLKLKFKTLNNFHLYGTSNLIDMGSDIATHVWPTTTWNVQCSCMLTCIWTVLPQFVNNDVFSNLPSPFSDSRHPLLGGARPPSSLAPLPSPLPTFLPHSPLLPSALARIPRPPSPSDPRFVILYIIHLFWGESLGNKAETLTLKSQLTLTDTHPLTEAKTLPQPGL